MSPGARMQCVSGLEAGSTGVLPLHRSRGSPSRLRAQGRGTPARNLPHHIQRSRQLLSHPLINHRTYGGTRPHGGQSFAVLFIALRFMPLVPAPPGWMARISRVALLVRPAPRPAPREDEAVWGWGRWPLRVQRPLRRGGQCRRESPGQRDPLPQLTDALTAARSPAPRTFRWQQSATGIIALRYPHIHGRGHLLAPPRPPKTARHKVDSDTHCARLSVRRLLTGQLRRVRQVAKLSP